MWWHQVFHMIIRIKKPVLSAVNGVAAGSGLGITLCSDMAVCTEDARFLCAWHSIGLANDATTSYSLVKIVGFRRAMELMYTNRMLSATDALDWQIVNRVYSNQEFKDNAAMIAKDLAAGPTHLQGMAKAGKEIRRFITKNPLNAAMGHVHWTQVPIHKGEPYADPAELPEDPKEIAKHIKSLCYFLDSDIVGICECPEWAWYSEDLDGKPIKAKHKYAIVVVNDQRWETLDSSSGDDWISGAQSYRAYLKGSTTAVVVADYIRRLGYEAQAHSNADGDVMQIPLMLLAGLGELSRIGELVLNPFIGPRHKTAVITTNLPMEIDKPIDFGLQDFCSKCQKCARECPAQAIPYGEKVLYNGYEIWKPDVEKCTKYRVTNAKGSSCGRCMKMCPWNKEGLLREKQT